MTRSSALLSSCALALLLTLGCGGGGPTVVSITVTPANATIKVGQTQGYQAVAMDAQNKPIADAALSWVSSDTAVATISRTGVVTGAAPGNAVITAYSGNTTGTARVSVVPNVNYTLAVTVSGTGQGTVSSSPSGLVCTSGTCTASFPAGTQVILTASGSGGAGFSGWSGACLSNNACTLTMDGNKSVVASFTAPPTLTVNVTGGGTVGSFPAGITCGQGSSPCSAIYPAGAQVTLTATPVPNGVFSGWSGACTGAGSCTVTMNADQQVTATFINPPNLNVTINGGGRVTSTPAGINCSSGTCAATYQSGTNVTLTAMATTGNLFTGWSGACTGTTAICTVAMGSDQSVTANFAPAGSFHSLSVTVASTAGGTGTVTSSPAGISCTSGTCTSTWSNGTSVTLTVAVGAGSTFTGWSGACTGTGTCTVDMTAARTVTATFAGSFTLTVSSPAGGTLTSSPAGITCPGTCSASFPAGATVQLSPTPDPGYAFTSWGGACTGSAVPCSVTMNANKTVSATWNGPFDYALSTSTGTSAFSLVPGEARPLTVTVSLARGSGLPVALSLSALPANVNATFNPTSVTPPGTATLTLTAATNAAVGVTPMTITGTSGALTRTATFNLDIRSPNILGQANGLAVEGFGSGSPTALVANADRIDRVNLSTMSVVRTIASRLSAPIGVAVEAGGNTALVTHGTRVTRLELATGVQTDITTSLFTPSGIAIESGGASALVTDCGPTSCATSGRLVRVQLSNGSITPITPAQLGLNNPRGVAIEPGGTTALITEKGTGRVLRIVLATGGDSTVATAVAYGLSANSEGIAIENGGATAIVTGNLDVTRVHLATGSQTRIASFSAGPLGGLALTNTGDALVTDRTRGQVVRIQVSNPVRTLAPWPASVTGLFQVYGVSPESSTSVLATDCGPSNTCATAGRILRINLNTGTVTAIATSLNNLKEIAAESVTSALVIEQGTKRLLRVDTTNGALTPLATFTNNPDGLAIEPGGTTALVTAATQVIRVTLATGTQTPVFTLASSSLGGVSVIPGSPATNQALVTERNRDQLLRVNLTDGVATVVATGFANLFDVSADSNGTTAKVSEGGLSGRVYQVSLATGALTMLGYALGTTRMLASEGSGDALVAEGNRLIRVSGFGGPVVPSTLYSSLAQPTGFVVEPDNNTGLLLVDCGFASASCPTQGSLVRVDLGGPNNPPTYLVNNLLWPRNLALEASGTTALVTECTVSNGDCSTGGGRLSRVTYSGAGTGTITPITTGMLNPDGIFIEPGGTTALVTERAGRLLRVTLSTGQFAILASGLANPRQVHREASGTTALVAVDNAIRRVNLSNGTTTLLATTNVQRFVVEGNFGTALVISTGTDLTASLARVNLTSGAVTLLATGLPDSAFSIARSTVPSPEIYVTENRLTSGQLWHFNTP